MDKLTILPVFDPCNTRFIIILITQLFVRIDESWEILLDAIGNNSINQISQIISESVAFFISGACAS